MKRQAFYSALLLVPNEGKILNFSSVAIGLKTSRAACVGWLNDLRRRGIIRTRPTLGQGLFVEILDRDQLTRLSARQETADARG